MHRSLVPTADMDSPIRFSTGDAAHTMTPGRPGISSMLADAFTLHSQQTANPGSDGSKLGLHRSSNRRPRV